MHSKLEVHTVLLTTLAKSQTHRSLTVTQKMVALHWIKEGTEAKVNQIENSACIQYSIEF